MLADEREMKLKRNYREEESHESPSSSSTVERGGNWVLLCFAHRHQFRVSRRFGLEREIASLVYIFAICVNNVSYERYVIFIM